MRDREPLPHPPPRLSPTLTPFLPHRRTPFVAWTGEPYWNLSNAAFGFPAAHPLAAFILACALAHAPVTPHAFIPFIAGPSFFTTAVKQGLASGWGGGVGGGGGGEAGEDGGHASHHRPPGARARAHHPPSLLRLLPQPLFIGGTAVGGVAPYTRQSNDYSWKEKK